MVTGPTPGFDVFGPILPGTTLLEASAGTGKTWSITTLVVRLIAEAGFRAADLLIVTFTEAATEELRERVRLRLSEAARALAAPPGAPADTGLEAWAGGLGDGPRAAAAHAIEAALQELDQAVICTIHSFCHRTLTELAFEAGAEIGLELTQDLSPVLDELVDDLITLDLVDLPHAEWRLMVEGLGWTRATLGELARLALRDRGCPVLPAPTPLGPLLEARRAAAPALARRLEEEWGPALVDAVAAAIADGRFKKRQSTWKVDGLRAMVQAAVAGLRASPLPTLDDLGPLAAALHPDAYRKQLVDPEQGPDLPDTSELVDALGLESLAGPLRAGFVHRLRAEVARRKAGAGICDFDDLLRLLRDRIRDPTYGPPLAMALSARHPAVFIDEFQDTDAVQWEIFHTCFHTTARRGHLFLIGDPKQAIYRFRGADLRVYLDAADVAHQARTMTRNHRSDAALIGALNRLYGGDPVGAFCQPPVAYVEVDTPPRAATPRLRGPDGAPLAPFVVRHIPPPAGQAEWMGSAEALRLTRDRLVADVVELLQGGAELATADGWARVRPGDVAVLTRRNAEAATVAAALQAAGVPAVVRGGDTVFSTPEAEALVCFLEALLDPSREGPARALALLPGWGWTATSLRSPDARWDQLLGQLSRWRRIFDEQGLMVAFRAAAEDVDLLPRRLAQVGGHRAVTNLLHVVELAHGAERAGRLGLPSLHAWLQRQRAAPPKDAEASILRLETDAAAVQVVTLHRSKGLEYPVVFLHEAWLRFGDPAPPPWLLGRDPDDPRGVSRRLDLRAGHPELWQAHLLDLEEGLQEDLRLLYVGLTRARHRLALYHPAVEGLGGSALGVLVHGGGPGERPASRIAAAQAALDGDDAARAWGSARRWAAAGLEVVEGAPPALRPWFAAPSGPAVALGLRRLGRPAFDGEWRRYSYSAITRGQSGHQSPVVAAPDGVAADRGDPLRPGFDPDGMPSRRPDGGAGPEEAEVDPALALPLPLGDAPANAEAGTFLHAVLEHADFPDALAGAVGLSRLQAVIDAQLGLHGFRAEAWGPGLADAVARALRTPLGGPLGARRLADVRRADRLDELRFDLPLAGGDPADRAWARLSAITAGGFARAMARRAGGPVVSQAYLDALAHLRMGRLRGFLTGSIDLAFRVRGAGGEDRWFVVDYKSNRLPLPGGAMSTAGYTLPRLRIAMEEHHYYIQYHLYCVALRRFLRSRGALGAEARLGGVYYLFLRGMIGEETPVEQGFPTGVFFDEPPDEVLDALDRLFDGATDR
jgi:exodeoxyribonuclease V beta subunit